MSGRIIAAREPTGRRTGEIMIGTTLGGEPGDSEDVDKGIGEMVCIFLKRATRVIRFDLQGNSAWSTRFLHNFSD